MTLSCSDFNNKYQNISKEEATKLLCTIKGSVNNGVPSNKTQWKINFLEKMINGDTSCSEQNSSVEDKPFQVQVAEKYIQLYKSACKRNKDFDLDMRDVGLILKQKRCYYTGMFFDNTVQKYKRTVDRVDHSKGYVKGNVVAATHFANQYKNDIFERPSDRLDENINMLYKIVEKVKEKSIE